MDLFSKFTSQFKKEEPDKPEVQQEPVKEPAVPILDQWEAYMKINGHIPFRDFKMLIAREATIEELKTMSEFEKKQRRQGDKQKFTKTLDSKEFTDLSMGNITDVFAYPYKPNLNESYVDEKGHAITISQKEDTITIHKSGNNYNLPFELKYDSMPQGMKEAQERNGIKDHGLELFDKPQDDKSHVELDITLIPAKLPAQIMEDYVKSGIIYQEDIPYIKCYVSIDPGQKGGIVAMTENKVVGKWEMPLLNDRLDKLELNRILTDLTREYNCIMIVEDVHSIYGTSSGSNFSFGYICGQIDMVVSLLRVKRYDPQPKFWQKNVWIDSDKVYKPLKPDQKKASIDTKATSSNAAKRLFPNEDLRGNIIEKYYADNAQNRKLNRAGQLVPSAKENDHDGIVDALLMCEVARKLNY